MSANDIVLVCCKDEEDIIETFVRFYLHIGFDAIHIVDNGSTDRTPEILASLIAEGLPVSTECDDILGYDRVLTKWYRSAGERYSPRWLFFLDCDEFILFPATAKQYLNNLPQAVNRIRLRMKEVYPQPLGSEPLCSFLLNTRIQREFDHVTKDITKYSPSARVRGGKHLIENPNAQTLEPDEIFIRHYKYRNPIQAFRKERNRIEAEATYSDEDIRELSAFDFVKTKEWMLHTRKLFYVEGWRDNFAESIAHHHDDTMAVWAHGFLLEGGAPRYRTGA